MAELILISTLNGVLFGLLLFLMASGLTLIFSMMGVLNFAPCQLLHAGRLLRLSDQPLGRLLAGPDPGARPGRPAPARMVERFGLRNVHSYGHVAELLFTFGLAFVIEELVQIVWGKSPVDFRIAGAARLSRLHGVRHQLSRLQALHAGDLDRHLRRPVRHADAHAHRSHRAGRAHASAHGRPSRPQRAAASSCRCSASARRWPASPASSPGRRW